MAYLATTGKAASLLMQAVYMGKNEPFHSVHVDEV